jgi:hypothetical protein
MHTKTKLVWLELIGGLFGWVWIFASIGVVYFSALAVFRGSPWARVCWVIGIAVIAKWLARGFNDSKTRVAFVADLVAQGRSPEDAGKEWFDRYTGTKAP